MKENNFIKQLFLGGLILAAASSSVIAFMDSRAPEQSAVQEKLVKGITITTDSRHQSSLHSNWDTYNETVEAFRKNVLSGEKGNTGKKQLISSNYVVNKKQHANNNNAQYTRRPVRTTGPKAPVSRAAVPGYQSHYQEEGPIISDKSTSVTESNKTMKEDSTKTDSDHKLKSQNNSFAGNKYPGIISTSDVSEAVQSEDTNTVNSNHTQEKETTHNYSVSIERDLVSGSLNQGTMDLALSIYVDTSTPNGLIVKETIPEGWDVVQSTVPYDKYNPDTGEIKWLLIGTEIKNTTISYRIVRNDSTEGGTLFYGKYLYKDVNGKDVAMQINYTNGV